MDVVIMAGGKGERMGRVEKPLIEFAGRKLLDIAVEAALESDIGPVWVATSPHTPGTTEYAIGRGYSLIVTTGRDYHRDLSDVLERVQPFLSLACDLPFVRPDHIRRVVRAYRGRSITGVLSVDLVPQELSSSIVLDDPTASWVPVGINVVDRSGESDPFVLADPLLAYNVNSPAILRLAARRAGEDGA
jgi:adenosylcobinamide-phosphate guanylyltransferase